MGFKKQASNCIKKPKRTLKLKLIPLAQHHHHHDIIIIIESVVFLQLFTLTKCFHAFAHFIIVLSQPILEMRKQDSANQTLVLIKKQLNFRKREIRKGKLDLFFSMWLQKTCVNLLQFPRSFFPYNLSKCHKFVLLSGPFKAFSQGFSL